MTGLGIYRSVPLTHGKIAWVDQADYKAISAHNWYAVRRPNTWYAVRNTRSRPEGWQRMFYMHRAVLDAPTTLTVDHIDGNGLDNRRKNLRLADKAQQRWNSFQRGGASRFKGVYLDDRRRAPRWYSQIKCRGKHISLGSFATEEAAAAAYDSAAAKLYGEFARTNASMAATR